MIYITVFIALGPITAHWELTHISVTLSSAASVLMLVTDDVVTRHRGARWVCRCPLSVPECENRRPHREQTNGFSPVCVRMCVRRLAGTVKARSQTLQWNGL